MRPALAGSPMLGLLLAAAPAFAAEAKVDYVKQVKPILARCYSCHGGLEQKAKLRVDTAAALRAGGKRGPALVPGEPAESPILDYLTASNGARRMPPPSDGEALHDHEVALIRSWIAQGAVGPADEKPEADPKEHWAFRTPVRPDVPKVKNTGWVRNPIDAFVAAGHEKHGLMPQVAADRRTLLRRVTIDLTGLPPTREELAAFVADDRPDAYEKAVDRLLSSKQYGERWGRHWMDVWRYSDPWGLGAEMRNSQKHIWHWRDWIIESLNANRGYDQMVREMLAADELYPDDLDRLRASGFLARQYFKFNRNTWLEETVEHTSKAFLGLTMNCAKCHDHKYDPIKQTDYYRLRAFFEPYQVRTDQLPGGEVDHEKGGLPRAFDCNLETPTYLFVRGDDKQPVKEQPLAPGVPRLLALGDMEIKPVALPATAYSPGLRAHVLANHVRAAEARIEAARVELAKAKKSLAEIEQTVKESGRAKPPVAGKPRTMAEARAALILAEKVLAAAEAQPPALRARAAADRAKFQTPPAADAQARAREATLAERTIATADAEVGLARAELEASTVDAAKKAEADKKLVAARAALEQVRKNRNAPGEAYTSLPGSFKTLESNVESEASRGKPFPKTSSGRRTALANWITDARHPLTARVAANHIWARHFGKPLAPTVFDLGRKGGAPTHPELLDFLACELRDHHWSMKHLHRLIVTSNAYRMSSSSAERGTRNAERCNAIDGENRHLWRMNPVRMEAEVVRDSLLALGGDLDLTMGGPPVLLMSEETSKRRSLYFLHSHNDHHRFLVMFDGASVLECYRRAESVVPQQALALSNSKMALSSADKIAARLNTRLESVNDAAFVRAAFEAVLATAATDAECAECEQAVARLTEIGKKAGRADATFRARAALVHALLNHNDFITVR